MFEYRWNQSLATAHTSDIRILITPRLSPEPFLLLLATRHAHACVFRSTSLKVVVGGPVVGAAVRHLRGVGVEYWYGKSLSQTALAGHNHINALNNHHGT